MSTAIIDADTEFARIVDELTRRGFLAGGLGSAALAALAACSSSGGTGPSASPAATRQVDSVNGPITVPASPKRVVSLDNFSMAAMFDLGFDPVGIYSAGEQYVQPQFIAKWRSVDKISDGTVGGAVDVEKIAALRPDLIIGIDASKPPYEQLKNIAPTVILPFSASSSPWQDMAQDTAQALGQDDAFGDLKRRYADRAAQIKSTYADVLAATTWDVLQGGFDKGQFWLYGPGSSIGAILADAGVQFATGSAGVTGADGQQSLSYERIDLLSDADAIYYYATNDGKPANLGPALFDQTAFTRLAASEQKHLFGTVYFLPTGYSDAIGALDALEAALKTLKGTR